MPTLKENQDFWARYDWPERGDEWSVVWGGAENQWWGTLYPRLRHLLPAGRLLEIAPGYGRFTAFLGDHCAELIGVDLSERCVEACRGRFADRPAMSFHVNDGVSLPMVEDRSMDLVFSFDSLVHCEEEVLRSYVREIARVLGPDGVAFLHHSNLAAFRDPASGRLTVGNPHWRAESMSAERMRRFCAEASVLCIGQELVNWGVDFLSDCFSLVTPAGSRRARDPVVVENREFMAEAERQATIAGLYGVAPLRRS